MIVIPDNLPVELAPIAWMLGTWQGWGMLSQEGEAPDRPVIEEIRAEICDTQMRMTTSIYAATTTDGAEMDPMLDSFQGLAALTAGELLREETMYLRLLPGSGELPPPGEYEPRELMASAATTNGLAALWAGVSMGPRIQMISDAIARDSHAQPIEHQGRMYGLVGGEMMWTQEHTLEGQETAVDISGRLARVENDTDASPASTENE